MMVNLATVKSALTKLYINSSFNRNRSLATPDTSLHRNVNLDGLISTYAKASLTILGPLDSVKCRTVLVRLC